MNRQPIPIALYMAMLCQFAVGGAVIPFAGLLLQERGMSYAETSHIFALSSSMLLIFPFLWGMVADRFISIDRLFTILNILAFGAMGFLFWQWEYQGLLIGFLMFYSFYHPTFTLINALCFHHLAAPEQQFGHIRAWGSIGWIVPSLPISLCLVWRPEVELGFVLYVGMIAALSMIGVTFLLPKTSMNNPYEKTSKDKQTHYWQDIKVLIHNRNYVVILISFFLISGSFSLLIYYSPPYLASLGMHIKWIGPVQCIGVILEVLAFPYLRILLERWGYRYCLILGALCLMIRHLLYVISESLWLLSISYMLAGMLIVFFYIGASIMVNHMAGKSIRASAQMLLVLIGSGLGPLFTNIVVAFLMQETDANLTRVFLFAALLAFISIAIIWERGNAFEPFHSKDQSQ